MDIFQTMLFFRDYDVENSYLIDTIYHAEHWWLVASWLIPLSGGERIPERILLMDGVLVQFQEVNEPDYRFFLNTAIPKSVFDGKAQDDYVVAIHPAAVAHTLGPKSIH